MFIRLNICQILFIHILPHLLNTLFYIHVKSRINAKKWNGIAKPKNTYVCKFVNTELPVFPL